MRCLFCGRLMTETLEHDESLPNLRAYYLNTWYRGLTFFAYEGGHMVSSIYPETCWCSLIVDQGVFRCVCKTIKYDEKFPITDYQYRDFIYLGFNPPSHIKEAKSQHIRPVDYVDLDMIGLRGLIRKGFKI